MEAKQITPNADTPELQVDRTTFRLKNPLRVSDRQFARGDIVATIELPRGIRIHDALNVIRTGQAVDRRIC